MGEGKGGWCTAGQPGSKPLALQRWHDLLKCFIFNSKLLETIAGVLQRIAPRLLRGLKGQDDRKAHKPSSMRV